MCEIDFFKIVFQLKLLRNEKLFSVLLPSLQNTKKPVISDLTKLQI